MQSHILKDWNYAVCQQDICSFGNFRKSTPFYGLLSICIHCRTEEDARVEHARESEKVLSVRIAYGTQESTGSRMMPDIRGASLEMW